MLSLFSSLTVPAASNPAAKELKRPAIQYVKMGRPKIIAFINAKNDSTQITADSIVIRPAKVLILFTFIVNYIRLLLHLQFDRVNLDQSGIHNTAPF